MSKRVDRRMDTQKDGEIWNLKALQQVYETFDEIGFVTACMKCL